MFATPEKEKGRKTMSKENIVRAWKDPEYRQGLSASERSSLPQHPAGAMALGADDLRQVSGGFLSLFHCTKRRDPYTSVSSIVCC